MSATPMRLEDALRLNGYTIDTYVKPAFTVTTPSGVIAVPELVLSQLTWRRDEQPFLSAALYLDRLPCFADAYKPVQLSNLLDRFRTRRIGYDTLDQFGLAVRRWANLNLGPNSTLNRRYLTAAVELPLDTVNMVYDSTRTEAAESSSESADTASSSSSDITESSSTDSSTANTKGRAASSDFPQAQLSDNLDYATGATDRVDDSTGSAAGETTAERNASSDSSSTSTASSTSSRDDTEHRTEQGRSGRSVMELLAEQREAFLNVDAEFLELAESLFLGVFDRSESEPQFSFGFRYGSSGIGW